MSIKLSLLALLDEQPMYGAQLRTEFEARTGGTWPLNIGQVYTTLDRLVRDDLIEIDGVDEEGRTRYRLTADGRATVIDWWRRPVAVDPAPRSELAIKIALAATMAGVDVHHLVQTQRTATMRRIADLTRLRRHADGLAFQLVTDHLIFAAEAEARWLDHVQASLPCRPTRRRPPTEPAGSAIDQAAAKR